MATRDDWRFVTREEKRPLRTIHDSRRFRFHVVVFASWWKREKITDASHRAVSHVFLRGGEARPNAQFKTRKRFFRPGKSTNLHTVPRHSMLDAPLSAMGLRAHPQYRPARRTSPRFQAADQTRHSHGCVTPRAREATRADRGVPNPPRAFTRRSPRCRDSTPTPRLTPSPRSRPRLHHARRRAPRPLEAFARARRAQARARARARRPARGPLPATPLALAFPPRSPRARASRRRRRRRRRFPSPAWTPRSRS
jgi:hypothetical protein